MTKREAQNTVIQIQMLAQLLLEKLETLSSTPLWVRENKKFGNLAIKVGDKLVSHLTSQMNELEIESYLQVTSAIEKLVDEIKIGEV